MHVVQNQMLAAGSLKISFITMSQFSASLYEFDIPEFFLRPCFIFFPEALRSVIFLALLKNARLMKKVSEYMLFWWNYKEVCLKQSSLKEMMYVILASIHCMYIRGKRKDDVDSLLAGMLL